MSFLRLLTSTPERRLLFIALFVRLVPAALIYGSDDVSGWETWGRMLAAGTNPYTSKYAIVWSPLWLLPAWFSYITSEAAHLPFYLVVKLFPIAADLILTLLLYAVAVEYGRSAYATALAYALNPISIYTSAVHGQFDPLPMLCLTIAVVLMRRSDSNSVPARAGAWLGIAAAFKTWPLFLLPALLAPLRTVRRQATLTLIAMGLFVAALFLPWPFLGTAPVIGVLVYRGTLNWWGISSIAFLRGAALPASVFTSIFFVAMGAVTVLVLVRKMPAASAALLLLLTFYVTAPGFGLQYLVWIVPIALLADQRRGLIYSVLGGLLIAFEVIVRPYGGHVGDMVRLLPHAGYARAYGGAADHTYTAAGRLMLWLFFCWWWGVTILSEYRFAKSVDIGRGMNKNSTQ
ncbi:MAG: hypothetical protein M3P29_13460 [Acidobacteriota bacterium]|nr:hypothetical protein [Acidobacteriota bacterium]